MTADENQINELIKQLHELKSRHLQLNKDIVLMQQRLEGLGAATFQMAEPATVIEPAIAATPVLGKTEIPYIQQVRQNRNNQRTRSLNINRKTEDFIGTNVISKIGILITIIGVFIGAKYAIDNELISPFMRILSGYAASAALITVAFRLKKKYEYFSSVLMGGGLAVIYFITYIAFSFYSLLPMWLAFVVMGLTTFAAVAIALWYNQKVIALIGQIAAYGIPFLLGNSSGNIFGLFAYISFINIGLLILSFKKDWKALYRIAFFLTWLIYFSWLIAGTQITKHFSAGLLFLTVNFFTFYITFLSYKIFKKEQYRVAEIAILLLNALFYFFAGTYLIDESFENIHFLTWFTIANAAIHFAAGFGIYRLKLADATVFQFVSALGLLFVTVAVPIELDGSWVTLLWIVEATCLFYIALANNRSLYLQIALPLVTIAVVSLLHDWSNSYYVLYTVSPAGFYATPFTNINFWLSLFVCACLGYISYAAQKKPLTGIGAVTTVFFNKIIPFAFLIVLYFTLFNEIDFAWSKTTAFASISALKVLWLYSSITLINFSCIYVSVWLFVNNRLIKKEKNHQFLLLLAAVASVVFITRGLYLLGNLREIYLSKNSSTTFGSLLFYRYSSLAALALLWISDYKSIKNFGGGYWLQVIFSSLFNLTLLSVISNEFTHWMDLAGYQNQYKLGLTLICGAYALALVFIGMIKNKKHLRISAMLLFGVTLFKLFFYDLASLSTISKTIVLVLLGVLLLFASFLYNKYKDLVSKNEAT